MSSQPASSEEVPQDTVTVVVPNDGGEAVALPADLDYESEVLKNNRLTWKSWRLVGAHLNHEFFFKAMMDRGAVLSFFTILTAVPTLLAVYAIATLILANNAQRVNALTDEMIDKYAPPELGDNVRTIVNAVIGSAAEGTITLIVSVLVALFSSSAYVRAFARSANAVYGRLEGRSLIRTWFVMWVLTMGLIVGVVVLLITFMLRADVVALILKPIAEPLGATERVMGIVDRFLPIWEVLRWPVILVLSITLVAVLYHFAPNVKPSKFRWLTVGSSIVIVASAVVGLIFNLYVTYLAGYNAYGALGTAVVFLGCIWAINTVLVFGLSVDAEILRAKELQSGIDASAVIHAPPRACKSALVQGEALRKIIRQGRVVKR